METRAVELTSTLNGGVTVKVIPGHFATKHSHVSHCIDMTKIKSEMNMALATAKMFAEVFRFTPVDTIISLERMKMVGAFLASDLAMNGLNINRNIAVISPEITNDLLLLRDNFLPYVKGQHVLLLTASATTGQTIMSALEGIRYYGGEAVGAATVFGGDFQAVDVPVARLFSVEDIPGYQSHEPTACPLCRSGVRVDALVNSYGYSKI